MKARQDQPQAEKPRWRWSVALLFVLLDIAGTVLFAVGVMWFFDSAPKFISGFLGSILGAVVAIVGGFLLMTVAASRILALPILDGVHQAERVRP
jgi:formate-dependent nitrite reductase membrane component NrfD